MKSTGTIKLGFRGKLISSEFAQIAQNYETKGDLTDAELAFTLHFGLWIKTFHGIALVHPERKSKSISLISRSFQKSKDRHFNSYLIGW